MENRDFLFVHDWNLWAFERDVYKRGARFECRYEYITVFDSQLSIFKEAGLGITTYRALSLISLTPFVRPADSRPTKTGNGNNTRGQMHDIRQLVALYTPKSDCF